MSESSTLQIKPPSPIPRRRKRRPDKRKTYWSTEAARIWIFCPDLEKLEHSGALDDPVVGRAQPEMRAIVDAAVDRVRKGGGIIAPGAQSPEAVGMLKAASELTNAIECGKLKIHKKGVRASDVIALWPSRKKPGRPHSRGRAKLRFQMATLILTEHRDEHYSDNSVRSGEGCIGPPRTPHMYDLRKGLRSNYAATILREALVSAASEISFLEAWAAQSTVADQSNSLIEKMIARGEIAFLTRARAPSTGDGAPFDLDVMRRNYLSWLKKGRPALVPKHAL